MNNENNKNNEQAKLPVRENTEDASILKEYERRHELRMIRRKRIILSLLAAALLSFAVVSTVTLVRFSRYNKAAAYYTAGEYERSARAFMEMEDYMDSKARVYWSAVELYKEKEYEKALPFFVWLDGYMDKGYYLRKCQEKLGL